MIFQSLIALYERQAKMDKIPSYGFSDEDIGFVISIDKEGNLIGQPEDLRTKIKANIFDFRKSVVPYTNQVNVRSGNASATPNFMVDKADYIFGMSGTSKRMCIINRLMKGLMRFVENLTMKVCLPLKHFLLVGSRRIQSS